MAYLKNNVLFFTTSPRTPAKMIPEIKLLSEHFEGKVWNNKNQIDYIDLLAAADFFEGSGSISDKAFSARDRINRAPKALGFIDLSPSIHLTDPGFDFVYGKRQEEIFLRQLLKFQLPSPFHRESEQTEGCFFVKPYLEIIRLINSLGYLTFDELKIFGLQLTDYRKFNEIKDKITNHRREVKKHQGQYKKYLDQVWTNEICEIHKSRISEGNTKTRESSDASLKKFIKTQKSNMRDYADACFRYLRYTGLTSISYSNRSISIFEQRQPDVDFILRTISREPDFVNDIDRYKAYLYDRNTPQLYVDNKNLLIDSIMRISQYTRKDLSSYNIDFLKDLKEQIIEAHKNSIINGQIQRIKSYSLYSEIIDTYNEIISDNIYDAPLIFEYNTWRAMTMLDGGVIKGNFKFDDAGQPLSTASGNMPDIECNYDDFVLSVEVTLQSGQRQYESEGESVARHFGKLKRTTGKDAYCLFIAPSINPAALAHFYGLNHIEVSLYGGKAKIIPLELDLFMKMIESSYNYKETPSSHDIRLFLDEAISECEKAMDENQWKSAIRNCAEKWLNSVSRC